MGMRMILSKGLGLPTRIDPFPLYSKHHKECGFYYDPGHLGIEGNEYLAKFLLEKFQFTLGAVPPVTPTEAL